MREIFLIIHFIGLALGIGTGFAFMFLGRASSKMEKNEAIKFVLNTLTLRKMGQIGLILLIISGLYLIIPYWSSLTSMPTFVIKLILVLALVVIIVIMDKYAKEALKGNTEIYLNKIKILSKPSQLIGIIIVILAIYTFH